MSHFSRKKEKEERYIFLGKFRLREKKSNFITLLMESAFNVSYACRQVGIHRRTYERWRQTDKEFERACHEIQEGIYDEAEIYLQKKIREGDTRAIIFFLKTKCKDRGYTERIEENSRNWEPRDIPMELNFNQEGEEQFRKMQEEINRKKEEREKS